MERSKTSGGLGNQTVKSLLREMTAVDATLPHVPDSARVRGVAEGE